MTSSGLKPLIIFVTLPWILCSSLVYSSANNPFPIVNIRINEIKEMNIGLIKSRFYKGKRIEHNPLGFQVVDPSDPSVDPSVSSFYIFPDESVRAMYWSPSGNHIVTLDEKNETIDIWESETQKRIGSLPYPVHNLKYLSFNTKEDKLITADDVSKTLLVWQIANTKKLASIPFNNLVFSDENILSITFDKRNDNIVVIQVKGKGYVLCYLPPQSITDSNRRGGWIPLLLSMVNEREKVLFLRGQRNRGELFELTAKRVVASTPGAIEEKETKIANIRKIIEQVEFEKKRLRSFDGAMEFMAKKLRLTSPYEAASLFNKAFPMLPLEEQIYIQKVFPHNAQIPPEQKKTVIGRWKENQAVP